MEKLQPGGGRNGSGSSPSRLAEAVRCAENSLERMPPSADKGAEVRYNLERYRQGKKWKAFTAGNVDVSE